MEGRQVSTFIELVEPDSGKDKVVFQLVQAPDGSQLDPQSGEFRWTPTEQQAPGRHEIRVRATSGSQPEERQETTFWIAVAEQNSAPEIQPIEDVALDPGEAWQIVVQATDRDEPPSALRYELGRGPKGASIDAATGLLSWTPQESDAGRNVRFSVRVLEDGIRPKRAEVSFQASVREPARPRDRVIADLEQQGLKVFWKEDRFEHAFQGSGSTLLIDGEEFRMIEYVESDAARQDGIRIATRREELQMPETPDSWAGPLRYLQRDDVLLVYGGLKQEVYEKIAGVMGEPLESEKAIPTPSSSPAVQVAEAERFGRFAADDGSQILELYENGQLFKTRSYALLRGIFARRFVEEQEHVLQNAWGDDYEAMMEWLKAHPDIMEEFFTAIDPQTDDLLQVLNLFKSLKDEFPDHIGSYGNLAVAIAVSWDSPKAVYRYTGPQRQGKAIMPDQLATAIDNFSYFINTEGVMQGRLQLLPWEFLLHVANHTTPLAERQWALQNYLGKRTMYGSCYKDVPYDYGMLESKGTSGRIHDKLYTLPNLRTFGGVCAIRPTSQPEWENHWVFPPRRWVENRPTAQAMPG